jgi:hypothetical protein
MRTDSVGYEEVLFLLCFSRSVGKVDRKIHICEQRFL